METYDLKQIMSGEDEYCLWVMLGFSSDLQELDVLHVVCSKSVDDQDRKNEMDGIYLERFDQAYGGHKGADSIRIYSSEIQIGLNAKGQEALDFKGSVTFCVSEDLKAVSYAYAVFASMRI